MAEDKFHSEFNKLLEFLRETKGAPVDISRAAQHAIARVITNVVYSSSYQNEDPEVNKLIGLIQDVFATNFSDEILSACMLPLWLMNIVNPGPMKRAKKANEKIKMFMMEIINEHRASLDKDNPSDIVDAYLIEKEGTNIDEDALALTLIMFIFDAIETLQSIVMTGFLQIVSNPEIQDKLQEELDRVVGKSGRPGLGHRSELKYLLAVTLETLRVSHVVPMGLEHTPKNDTKLEGYDLPRGCLVHGNLYSVHMDPDIFPEPERFSPEHFLNSAGEIINNEYCIPFSVGRRMCIGDQMSKTELYMLFASVFHQFRLSFPPGHSQPAALESLVIYLQKPPPFQVCAVPR